MVLYIFFPYYKFNCLFIVVAHPVGSVSFFFWIRTPKKIWIQRLDILWFIDLIWYTDLSKIFVISSIRNILPHSRVDKYKNIERIFKKKIDIILVSFCIHTVGSGSIKFVKLSDADPQKRTWIFLFTANMINVQCTV